MTGFGERGAASVLALVLIGALTSATLAAVLLGGLVLGQRRAAAAADLAALAGAAAVQQGQPGCTAAGLVAAANGTRLTSCSEQGETVLVAVVADAGSVLGSEVRVPGRARAGPVG